MYSPMLYILEDSKCDFRDVRLCDLDIPREKWMNYLQTEDSVIMQTPRSAVSDLGLHCLPITLLGSPDYNPLIEE